MRTQASDSDIRRAMNQRSDFLLTVQAAMMLAAACAFLYGPFLGNPPLLDDARDFAKLAASPFQWLSPWSPRSIAYGTLAFTYQHWAGSIAAYRIGDLLIHWSVAVSLYVFVRDLLRHQGGGDAHWPALLAAALFAVHPVAGFAVNTIVQRAVVLSGLFSLWMWIAVHRGVAKQRLAWLIASVVFYLLAVQSKEHAVIALPVALLVGWNAADGQWRRVAKQLAWPLAVCTAIAIAVVLRSKGIVGHGYEPHLAEMGLADGEALLLRSQVNQAWLYFRYLLLWLLPYPGWMAIDLRTPFPPAVASWPWLMGLVGFIAYPIVTVLLLRRRRLSRLAAVGVLAPWLLFAPSFAAVLYQEPFVLYRSYYGALPAALLAGLAMAGPTQGRRRIVALFFVAMLFGLTWHRLTVFSDPVQVWSESIDRLHGDDRLPGAYRLYKNRGVALAMRWEERGNWLDMKAALGDFDKVVALTPQDATAYVNRGQARQALGDVQAALADYSRAISLAPTEPTSFVRRGMLLLELQRRDEALADLAAACVGHKVACDEYVTLLNESRGQ